MRIVQDPLGGKQGMMGQDAEESKEGLRQVMWRIGVAWLIQNVTERKME